MNKDKENNIKTAFYILTAKSFREGFNMDSSDKINILKEIKNLSMLFEAKIAYDEQKDKVLSSLQKLL